MASSCSRVTLQYPYSGPTRPYNSYISPNASHASLLFTHFGLSSFTSLNLLGLLSPPGSLHKLPLLSGVFSSSLCHLMPLLPGWLNLNITPPGMTDTTGTIARSSWFHSPQRRRREVSELHSMVRWVSMSSVHLGAQAGACEHMPSGLLQVLLLSARAGELLIWRTLPCSPSQENCRGSA